MKTNLEALKAVYVKNGGSLTDTYEDIAGGAPVSAYKTLKDAIAALSKLTLGGGGSGLPEVTDADNGKIMQVESGEWTKMPKVINVSFSADALSKIADKLGTHISTVISNPTNHYCVHLLISQDQGFTEDEFNSIRETLVFCLNSKNSSPIYLGGILLTQITNSNILKAPYIYILAVGNTEYRIEMSEKYIVYETKIDCYITAQALLPL